MPEINLIFISAEGPDKTAKRVQIRLLRNTLALRYGGDTSSSSIWSWDDPRLLSRELLLSQQPPVTHITFISLEAYYLCMPKLHALINTSLRPVLAFDAEKAPTLSPPPHIFNHPSLTLWNSNKTYLSDLSAAGFPIPDGTQFLPPAPATTPHSLAAHLATLPSAQPVVLKPSVSASGRSTHLVQDPTQLTAADTAFIADVLLAPAPRASPSIPSFSSILIQDFAPDISKGELSLVFIHGHFTHAIRKLPRQGGWMVNTGQGGTVEGVPLAELPARAKEVARDLVRWVEEVKFAELKEDGENGEGRKGRPVLEYARVDGVMVSSDGRGEEEFVIMEFEAVEPGLWAPYRGEGPEDVERWIQKPETIGEVREGEEDSVAKRERKEGLDKWIAIMADGP